MVLQLVLAAVLLLGVASFTGMVDWRKLLRHVPFVDLIVAADVPTPPAPAPADGEGVLNRAFEAVPAGDNRGGRAPGPARPRDERSSSAACRQVDSTRLSDLGRRYGSWNREVLRLVACGQVRRGFNVEQVEAALGAPANVVQRSSGEEEWVYDRLRLIVKNGEVTAVQR